MDEINKKYGKNSIFVVEKAGDFAIESIPTGCLSLDHVFACGGLPRGRIVEVYGPSSSGKSTMAMFLAAQVQKQGGRVVWIDAEYSFSTKYAKNLGVDVNKIILSQPNHAEEALETISAMTKSNSVDLIVLDSVAALVPEKELDGDISDVNVAQQARLMSKAMRILAGNLSRTKTAVIFINQLRDKIGVMFGKKQTTPGGNALKFFASVRLEVRKGENIKGDDGDVIGNKIYISAVKNKVGLPFRKTDLDLYYTKGLDLESDTFDFGVIREIIIRSGNTYEYGGEKLGVGKDQCVKALVANKELFSKLSKELKKDKPST